MYAEKVEIRGNNPVAYYFRQARGFEEAEPFIRFMNDEGRTAYHDSMREVYDILYDRVMCSDISPCLKEEMEQWYDFNRSFLGFMDTVDINAELETILERFNFI